MRQLFGIIITLAFLTSCSESFKRLDPKLFNEKIANRTDIKTPQELILLYANYPESEGTAKQNIETKEIGNNNFEITLIHEGLEDDSQSAEKIVMTAKQSGQTWVVTEIKKNWKCWSDRGHTNWGTTPCN